MLKYHVYRPGHGGLQNGNVLISSSWTARPPSSTIRLVALRLAGGPAGEPAAAHPSQLSAPGTV
jgi:hypothetical protein